MSQPLYFQKALQSAAILSIAALYCLAPLQKPLADGFHKLEHSMLNTTSDHSHDNAHHHNMGHDHQMLSFFNNLFSENTETGTDSQRSEEIKLDKHVIQQYSHQQHNFSPSIKNSFFFLYKKYGIPLPNSVPPPEVSFS